MLILLLSSGVYQFATAQSAWTKKQGSGFLKLSEDIIVSGDFYDAEGNIVDITTTGIYITSLYGEYGLSDRFTGFFYVPFIRSTLNEQRQINSGLTTPGDEANSIGDATIGLAYGLKQSGAFVLNVSLALGLPLGDTRGGDTQLLQSGDGEFNQLIKLNAGYSFYPAPVYATAGIGFNNRTRDFSDEFHFNLEVGVTLAKNLNAALKINNVTSFNNGDPQASQTGIFSNNLEFLSIGPEIAYDINERFGVSANVLGAASGQNILASPSFGFGVFLKF